MKTANSRTFEDVKAWQKAHDFVLTFYQYKNLFPEDEKYALESQFQRAAISIAANIAEGYKKLSKADKLRFFNIAQGSLEECRYYVILARDLSYFNQNVVVDLQTKLEETSTVLNAYCQAIVENRGITDD